MWPVVLVENICKGIGRLGELVFGKKFREKEYRDTLMEAQGKRYAKAIEDGELVFTGEKLIPVQLLQNMPPTELVPLISGMEEEAHNLNATVAIAADILKDTPDDQVSDEPVNPDWFARWRREAQVIGDEEMRQLWGHILAEEVKTPHTISLKTLDILKNITAKDAQLFCKVVRFRINELIPLDPAPLGDYNLSNLLKLQELNLVNVDIDVRIGAKPKDDICVFRCNGFVLSSVSDKEFSLADLAGATLTHAGEEIYRISDTISSATEEEIKKIGDAVWANRSRKIRAMKAHPIISIGVRSYQYNPTIILYSWGK